MRVCADLSHDVYVYSSVEGLRDSAVVLVVTGFTPHFELENFFKAYIFLSRGAKR